MSTIRDDDRHHPQDPAEGAPETADDRPDAAEGDRTEPAPREHPQDPAEGPRGG